MVPTDKLGHAIPGDWLDRYRLAWNTAFPDSHMEPGTFTGKTWISPTPAWDKWWFESFGVKPPRRRIYQPCGK